MTKRDREQMRELRKAFPALGMSDQKIRRTANAQADQIEALHEPYAIHAKHDGTREMRRVRDLSPLWHAVPEIVAGVDRARHHGQPEADPLSVDGCGGEDAVWLMEHSEDSYQRMKAEAARLGVDPRDRLALHPDEYPERVLLNTGRPPQPLLPGGREYTIDDLRAHDDNRRFYEGPHIVDEIAEQDDLWQLEYERIQRGGAPIQTVLIHDDGGTEEHPVPMHCSHYRALLLTFREFAAREFAAHYPECWFCRDCSDDGLDALLLVSGGATMRAFPTCGECRRRFLAETNGVGLDFYYARDRAFFREGLPDDAYPLALVSSAPPHAPI